MKWLILAFLAAFNTFRSFGQPAPIEVVIERHSVLYSQLPNLISFYKGDKPVKATAKFGTLVPISVEDCKYIYVSQTELTSETFYLYADYLWDSLVVKVHPLRPFIGDNKADFIKWLKKGDLTTRIGSSEKAKLGHGICYIPNPKDSASPVVHHFKDSNELSSDLQVTAEKLGYCSFTELIDAVPCIVIDEVHLVTPAKNYKVGYYVFK